MRALPALLSVTPLLLAICSGAAETTLVPLKNPTFTRGVSPDGLPVGWGRYGGSPTATIRVVDLAGGQQAALLEDQDEQAEVGLLQGFPAQPGEVYQVTVRVRAVPGFTTEGAFCQLRFLPSNQLFQVDLYAESTREFETITVRGQAPAGTTEANLYLYCHRDPTPRVLVGEVRVETGFPAPPPLPEPAVKQYDRLRDMHPRIALVRDGQPACHLVIPASGLYREAARELQEALRRQTGVTVPVVTDRDPAAVVPLAGNLLVLGNRSTNLTSNALYDRHYSLMDLKWPGRGGFALRTLHDPFGDGHSAVLVGGSDGAGVTEAARVLARKLGAGPATPGQLAVGWMLETRLGAGLTPPADARHAEIWDASRMYGSTGYFGWNSLSKCMAQYYMTGDEHAAREVLRLAFPDAQALQEIDRIDSERIENKRDPLAGTYHYNSHMMMLFWDLIEESPVFSDEERLKIINAFARQIHHRIFVQNEGNYYVNSTPDSVSSRHGQWAAISLFVLGRYFNQHYPDPMWAQCQRGAELSFASLHKHAWVHGESDNLYWYNTGMAPILTYMVLTGDRKPLENGVLGQLLRGQEILLNGKSPDPNLNGAALDFLHKAAYLTGDGRWITYRQRSQLGTAGFRLGQSFWPDETVIKPVPPEDLVGRWSVMPMARPMWAGRRSGLPFAQSFRFASYRSTVGGDGDYLLLDGYNDASRNPYHTFAVLDWRLNGRTCFTGYFNQVLTSADSMVEPTAPMDGALVYREVVGSTVTAVGEVPRAAYSHWRRTLAQRTGRYAVVLDDVTFRADSQNMKVVTSWQPESGVWSQAEQRIRMAGPGAAQIMPGWVRFRALDAPCTSQPAGPDHLITLETHNTRLLRATGPGQWLEMIFKLDRPFRGEAFAEFLHYVDRGRHRVLLDGKVVVAEYDNWSEDVKERSVSLGQQELAAGEHRLRIEVLGPRAGGQKAYVGLVGVSLRPEGQLPVNVPASYDLCAAGVQEGRTDGGVVSLEWTGPARRGEHRRAFYLLGQSTETRPVACLQVADNAAACRVPQPALVASGQFRGNQGELVILAADHLYGQALTRAGLGQPLVTADRPVDLDWDFPRGEVHVVATQPTALTLRVSRRPGLKVDGEVPAAAPDGAAGPWTTQLPPGRHVITGAVPADTGKLTARLEELLAQGQRLRASQLAALSQPPALIAPTLSPALTAQAGKRVVTMLPISSAPGELLAVAEDKVVHLLTPEGREVRQLATVGNIRVLNWWADQKLLLVGCQDDKVIAFDEAGQKRWEFTSVMDPAVYEAAKPYWFKTAPGHEGVHSLYTGSLGPGPSQCFVGSACTLEVLDATGQLVKRLPVFWGPVWKYLPLPGAEPELALAQWPNGSDNVWILGRDLKLKGTRFGDIPAGHTRIDGWTAQNRTALLREDSEADGKAEVISVVNGTWNRVTVYGPDGTARYNAQFGPGASNVPRAHLCDATLCDLDADGRQEIIVGTGEGLVVALSSRCERLWSVKLPSVPVSLRGVPAAGKGVLVVGCADGRVVLLGGEGAVRGLGQVAGAPREMQVLNTAAGPLVVVGTDQGQVAGFRVL